jgi:hypothetical protein
LVTCATFTLAIRHSVPDWTSFAIKGAREVESARGDTELARKLTSLFSPMAPTVRVLTSAQVCAAGGSASAKRGARFKNHVLASSGRWFDFPKAQ